jgi:hypothetical protein
VKRELDELTSSANVVVVVARARAEEATDAPLRLRSDRKAGPN